MRILVDLRSHLTGAEPLITQVEKVPAQGTAGAVPINGKYLIPVVPGADFRVTDANYVLDGLGEIDGGDVASISYAHLLAMFPMFGHIYFNPLLTADHVSELDLTASFKDNSSTPPNPPTFYPTRVQTGRAAGPPDAGQMPTHTAILAQNNTLSTPRPGVLISDNIDISNFTGALSESGTAQAGGASTITLAAGASSVHDYYVGATIDLTGGTGAGQSNTIIGYSGTTKVAVVNTAWAVVPDGTTTYDITREAAGTDEFMVYWHLYDFTVSEDIAADFGGVAGTNAPAIRQVEETDPEPAGLSVYISTDDGVNWCDAGLLEPVAFAAKSTEFRVAFVNTGSTKVYLATFAVLF